MHCMRSQRKTKNKVMILNLKRVFSAYSARSAVKGSYRLGDVVNPKSATTLPGDR